MSTSLWSRARDNKMVAVGGAGLFLILAAVSMPNLLRSRMPLDQVREYEAHEHALFGWKPSVPVLQ